MKKIVGMIVVVGILVLVGAWTYSWYQGKTAPSAADTASLGANQSVAYVAGGCFWCTESDFQKLDGVTDAVSGYMGGDVDNPTYRQVADGQTGHREMVKVVYDPSVISYRQIVLELLRETDPTDDGGSFGDRGYQYTSAIYYQSEDEKNIAAQAIQDVQETGVFDEPVVTAVEPASTFWVAEEYHQDFSSQSSARYKLYRNASGRDDYIESKWGTGEYDYLFGAESEDESQEEEVMEPSQDETQTTQDVPSITDTPESTTSVSWRDYKKPSDDTLKEILSEDVHEITQENGTETPFDNAYWDNKRAGIYVDILSGEPLFSSTNKYVSGTGWPTFDRPIDSQFVVQKEDKSFFATRTEIRSRYGDNHIGHIFDDGPPETTGERWCMNSAALRFIPKEEMQEKGYGEYLSLFGS